MVLLHQGNCIWTLTMMIWNMEFPFDGRVFVDFDVILWFIQGGYFGLV